MSCLLPQFKCPPDAFSIYSKTHHLTVTTHLAKVKDSSHFRMQCMLSTTSAPPSIASTTMLNMEKLQLTSLEEHLNPAGACTPWTYIGGNSLPDEVNFRAALSTEDYLTGEEAVVAAAAAEALALAKAAVKVAKDAVLLAGDKNTVESDKKPTIFTSESDSIQLRRTQLVEAERFNNSVHSIHETGLRQENSTNNFLQESVESEPTLQELELLQGQLSCSIAVRSKRQAERKLRRAKAAEKSAASIVHVKSGSPSRKKRLSLQEVEQFDPLRYLRGASGSSRLLTAAEELELSGGIQDLMKLERLYEELMDRCGCPPTLAQWAAAAGVDQKTLKQRLNYGILCKDKMIKSNIRLVISIAKNYLSTGMNLQDLVQEGCRGLVKGAEKFDGSKGFKFSTYGHWWIKQAVRKAVSDQSRTIRLPFHMVEATYRVKEARKQLHNEKGREPSDEEVAEATGLSMRRLSAVLMTPKAPRSLDQKIGINMNLKPSEIVSDPDAITSEELWTKKLMKQDLEKVLDTLNPREKKVVRWRFGLDDGRMKTLQEIGELMGVSRERIRQIESCAFRKLKNKKRTQHLHHYLVPCS